MAEHVAAIKELQKLPDGVHIFCPRLSDNQGDDKANPQEEEKRLADAKERRDTFFSALPLLAYNGVECVGYHQWLYDTLDLHLEKCEACIRQYYLGRVDFKLQLMNDYEENEVRQFVEIIDRRDIARIKSGLDSAKATLESLPKEQQGPKALDNKQLFALFETLHAESFYKVDQSLRDHFDRPFSLVQSQKELKINEILPAITKFLFSSNSFRLSWAVRTWQRPNRPPTNEEWDWAIKGILMEELKSIKDELGLIRFWSALNVICARMSKEQIQLNLFDLDNHNFSRLSLDHLSKNTMAIPHIAQCLQIVWSKAPDAYWQALPSVSAATVAEQFFANPQFDKCLELQAKSDTLKSPMNVLSWIEAFLDGLQPANRPPAARTLAHQLFNRVNSSHLSSAAKQLCLEWGVRSLTSTVISFSEHESARSSAARPVLSDVLTIVCAYLPTMFSYEAKTTDADTSALREMIATLVRNSLALECLNFKSDYEALTQGRSKAHNSSYTPDLWKVVDGNLDPNHTDLSIALLISTMPLAGLEQLPLKNETALKTEKESFNTMFAKVEDLLIKCVDRLSGFPAEHLDQLFTNQNANMALMALLFSGNERIYLATVELIKNIAQEPGRVEALSHVIEAFFSNTLYSACWVFRRNATMMPFSPIPRLLKTGKDIMDLLCDTAGLLRSRKITERDRNAVQAYWQYSWQILTTIFRRMERWSTDVSNRPLMSEVCRNTMQYAQELFGHYYLFVKVLENGRPAKEIAKVPAMLLDIDMASSNGSPPKALDSMVKWLRLRDPYLAETLVNLIIDMLRRLKEYGTQIPGDGYALTFIEEVAVASSVKGKGTKTILNDNQKAGLIRALEQYTGKQILKETKVQVKKQQRLDSWTDSQIKREIITIKDDDEFSEGIKDENLDEPQIAEAYPKHVILAEKKEPKVKSEKTSSLPSRPSAPSLQEQLRLKQAQTSRAFIEKRKREEAAAKAHRAELAARVRRQAGNDLIANAGSGLAGLGVQGKDHSTPRSDLMVSSDSEGDSSEDDDLFGPGIKNNAPNSMQNRPKRPAVPMPTKKTKQVRSAKDMRARLSPDLTALHKIILAWDFFADTDTPPNSTREDYTLVSNAFKSVEEYQKTFEPLLVLEGWQSFRTAREDGNFKPFEFKVANSMIVDNFFEVNSTVSMAEGKELGLGPSDVVLLSKGSRPHVEPNEPHCLARVKEITRKRGEMQIVYRINSANNPLRQYLNDKATVFAVQILSLTPLEREYGALMALPYYDLAEEIIKAKPSPLLQYTDDEVVEIQELHNLNIAQAKAVKSAVDNDAFTLIQGPPGSGKTKTITAILSATMTGMANRGNLSAQRNSVPGPPPSNKKILVAAPSNAAVDELVMRFKNGIKVPGGSTEKINVVRLGRSEAINTAVKDVTLEELVNARLSEKIGVSKNGKEDIHSVMMEHKKASDEMFQLRQKMDAVRSKGGQVSNADDQLFEALKQARSTLSIKIDKMREDQNSASRDADIDRRRIQQEILDSAHVLCATLSGSGHEIFQGLNVEFDTVIIDEAAQSIELSALIPLKYGCSKCILVGDPKQLPPTVLSRQAAKYQYEQSLFARMEKNHKKDVHLLDVQYRMHPEISTFPSRTFYDSKLRDGGDMAELRARPWHRSQIFAPYRFFDVEGMSESAPKGRSLVNQAEIEVALVMYDRLISDIRNYDFKNNIGIITPYKGQLKALKQRFIMRYGENILNSIEFNTTDAFQGRESEIIIFSCVRASTQGIGFLNDVRRMNVGLTRAKCSLWVLGNSKALVQGEFWRALVKDAKDRSLYTDGNVPKLFERPLLTNDMLKDDVDMGGTNTSRPAAEIRSSMPSSSTADPSRSDTASSTPDVIQRQSRPSSATSISNVSRAVPRVRGVTPPLTHSDKQSDSSKHTLSDHSTTSESRPSPSSRQSSTSAIRHSPHPEAEPKPEQSRSLGVDGPSGGHNGLNSKVNCTICGSSSHYSHNCDNTEAREASLGKCKRCQLAGHTYQSCTTKRCLGCGDIGHVERACEAPASKKLNNFERKKVELQETAHERVLVSSKDKLAKKQLGEHGASIPTIKTSKESTEGKRKRDHDEEDKSSKAPRVSEHNMANAGPPKGPAHMRNQGTMVFGGPGSLRQGNGVPMVRKKNRDAADMFAKKR